MEMKKILVGGIILLFIGVAVVPTINYNVVKASTDDDLVEVTTQAYGIQGYGDTTLKLTREQYQNLEQYLVEFRAKLNQTTTRKEAVPIFKKAVVELNKYGLLPKGMSVERAQKLVIKNFQNELITQFIKRIYCEKPLVQDRNFFCLVAGNTTNTQGFGPFFTFVDTHGLILGFLSLIFENIVFAIWLLSNMFSFQRDSEFPLYLYGHLCFGSYEIPEHGSHILIPSEGWIHSYGIFGKRNNSGTLYGQIDTILGEVGLAFPSATYYYQGIRGFTGLKIYQSNNYFYLGSCLEVNVNATEPEPPEIIE